MPLQPVLHPGSCRVEIAGGNGLAFVSDAVDDDDAAAFHEEPEDAGVELANVAQFQQSLAKRFGERWAVVLAVALASPAITEAASPGSVFLRLSRNSRIGHRPSFVS